MSRPASTAPATDDPSAEFRWPVAAERTMPVPPGRLWAAIAAPGNLEPCHPFCARNPVTAWPGAGARDEVHYLNGVVFERRFRRWLEGVGYDLDVGRAGGPVSRVSWRVRPEPDGGASLRIVVLPHVLQRVPLPLRWPLHGLWLAPGLGRYLDAVVRGFEWYRVRGEPVPRNGLGRHPWFSARGDARSSA